MTDAKARLLQMIADEPHMAGGGLLKAVSKAQKVAKATKAANKMPEQLAAEINTNAYHGTNQQFDQFHPKWIGSATDEGTQGHGFYFTPNQEEAKRYGKNVIKATLGMSNPYVHHSKGESLVEKFNMEPKELTEHLTKLGYDSVISNYENGTDYLVFRPSQIKIHKATGGAVHMAGGGRTPKYPWERYEQPKKVTEMRARRINPIAGAIKSGADYATQLIDKGPSFSNLVSGLVGAIPFVGPDMRKRMEASDISIPTDITMPSFSPEYMSEQGTPVYKQAGIEMGKIPTKDLMEVFKVSDFTPFAGLSNVAESIGYGQMPDALDLLDAAGVAALGYGAVKAGAKGAKAAKQGALSAAKAAERFAEKKVPEVMERGGMGAQMLGAFGQNTASNVVKDTGGNWLSGSVENALKGLKGQTAPRYTHINDEGMAVGEGYGRPMTADEIQSRNADPVYARNEALNKWIDSNLTNYVKKQMATPGDPVRKLAEQGIVHIPSEQVGVNRYRAPQHRETYGGKQLGESEAAKAWEDASDVAINAPRAKAIKENESLYQANPWVEKLPNEARVFALNNPASYASEVSGLGFDHIVDVLKEDIATGRIRPEQLSKVSMEQAVRRTYEYDQDMAKKARETAIKQTEGMPIHKEYPEGYKWIELNLTPEQNALAKEYDQKFKTELGNRVAAYSSDKSKKIPVESIKEQLKKEMGPNPMQGLEDALKYEGNTMGHCVGGYCPDVAEGRSRIFSLRDAKGEPHVTVEVQPNFMKANEWLDTLSPQEQAAVLASKESITDNPAYLAAKNNVPPRIIQIKGKQNRAPKEDYLPFVQDFVKSGNWSDVGDIKNAGLRRTSDAFNENELNKIREAGIEVPTYATQEEIKSIGNQAFPDFGNVFYAEGGEVKSFFEEKSAKQRLLDMIAEEPHMGIGVRPSRLQLQGEIANDAFGGIGGGGRATYTHPVGSDAAIRAYIEGGGYKPKDMDYKGQVNNMGISYEKEFKDGGEAHMAGGGVLKAVAKAQKTAKKAKMYSAVDKTLEASKRGAGTGMEFANELAKTSGIKKAELVDRGIMVPSKNGPVLNPALTQLPKMTKQEFVSHLNEKYKPPGVRKITLGSVKFDDLSDQDLYKEYVRIRGSEPEAYGEPMSRDDILDELSGAPDEDTTKAKYSQYKLPGSENYRENLYQYENPAGKAFYQSHFDEPNVLYHMRQADRIEPTYTNAQIDAIGQRMAEAMGTKVENLSSGAPILMMRQGVISPVEAAQFSHAKGFRNMDMDVDMTPAQRRALHIEEIQSDWHQKGRDQGYKQPLENVHDKEYDSYIQDLKSRYFERLKETYAPGEADPVKASFEIRRNMTPEADPQKIAETMGELDILQDKFAAMYQERQAENVGVPDAPFKKNWHELALKQALMDAVEGDYDQLLITPGAEQSKRYDLSKQISKVRYFDEPNSDSGLLHAYDLEGNNVLSQRIPKEKVQDYIGKDAAEKLLSQTAKENERTGFPSQERTLSGLDLQVGGEGMAGFYDKMVPSYLNDIGKKYGVRVGERAIEGDVPHSVTIPSIADANRIGGEMFGISDFNSLSKEQFDMVRKAFDEQARAAYTTKLHTFDITPEMREDILNNGLPMYQRGGEVHMGLGGVALKAQKAAKAAKAAKVDHPLVFPRAAAKTINDIRPIAQRMADQMTGQFVKQNPKVTTNPAGKSRKQFERERNMPLETRNVVPERPAPDVNYEDYKGYGLVGVPGDPTLGGVAKRGSLEATAQPTVELTRVGDITPDYPVPLFGGPRYGDDEKFWASGLTAAVPIQNNVTELAKLYEAPVLGKYIKMGESSENFALHNLDALLSIQRPEKLNKAKMAQLTELIQAGSPKYGKFPGFTGFKDPADVLLQAQMDSKLRKHIAETLRKPTITDQLGLPNGLDVVAAITHPELRNLETGASGFSVGKMSPKSDLRQFQSSHPSYDTDIPGSFLGRSRYPTPYEIAFPDTTAYARSQMTPGVQEFNMMKMLGPRERIDQQYIDEIKMYEQLMKQYTGKKKGGLAHSKKVKRHGNTVSN